MQLRILIQALGGCVLALALAACASNASTQPTIIAATAVQPEPAIEEPAIDQSGAATEAATTTGEASAAALPVEPTAAAADAGEISAAAEKANAVETAPSTEATASATTVDDNAEAVATPAGEATPPAAPEATTVDAAAPEASAVIDESAARTDAPAIEQPAAPPPGEAEQDARTADASPAPATVAVAAATPSAYVDSYRLAAHFKMVASNANGVVADTDVTAEGAWQRADNAFGFDASFRMETIDNGAAQVIEYVMLGDHVALRSGDGWTISPRGGNLPLGEPVAMLDVPFAGALALGAAVGTEEIAGVPTTHYRIDNADEFVTLVADAFGGRAGTLTSITLDSWLAADGYIVQYLLAATTAGATVQDSAGADQMVDQTITVDYTMSDIGALDAIAWPADAPPADALIVPGFDANAFPLPENAQVQPSVGVLAFATALDEAGVRDFYAAQLGAAGWSLKGEYGYFTARRDDGLTLVLAVTPGGDGQPTRVEVFADRGE